MIEIRTELAEIIRFEQPLARHRLPAVHIRKAHCFQDHWMFQFRTFSSLQKMRLLAVARSDLCKGEMYQKLSDDYKTLVISRTGRMCIGGSGLCMEGEQRKNQWQCRPIARLSAATGASDSGSRGETQF